MIKNKKIVLTGASSGIGAELCRLLSEHNRVLGVSRHIDGIPENENVVKYACDISKPENLDRLFLHAREVLGDIDIFIANAGFAYYEYFDKPDWAHIESIFQTNVFSSMYSLAKMREIKGNDNFNFVITASAMSFLAMPGYSLYSATKFALKGFTDAFRYELPRGQRIQMVYPIATLTSFFDTAESDKIPWPHQKASTVARIVARGISRNKKHIFPSSTYRFFLILNRFIPVLKLYTSIEKKKMKGLKEK